MIQPTHEDSALIILWSVLKSGSHKKWMLVRLIWVTPPNQGPFNHVYREWSVSGCSRNIRLIVDALIHHYGDFNPLKNPYPSTIQALVRRLSSKKAAVATLEDCQHCDANTHCVFVHSLRTAIRRAHLACFLKGLASTLLKFAACLPCFSNSSKRCV